MIKNLKLTNYRKHEDLELNFSQGLVVTRGNSEAGKSTVIESILYAFFGAKVLRDSIDNTVTWGKKVNDLKVELTVEIGGELYLFSRSPKGAEVNYSRGIITGQNESSNFASELLGADANSAAKLMMAGQNQLRGTLDDGPKAISQTIETLADFDLFDRLLDAASQKLLTGSTEVFDRKVAEAQNELSELVIMKPDFTQEDKEIAYLESSIPTLTAELQVKKSQHAAATLAFSTAEQQKKMYEAIERNLQKATTQLADKVAQRENAENTIANGFDEGLLKSLQKQLESGAEVKHQEEQYKQFLAVTSKKLPSIWEGNKQSFYEEVERVEKAANLLISSIDATSRVVQGVVEQVKNLNHRLTHQTSCPTCHRAFDNHSELLAQNEAVKAEISTLEMDITGKKAEIKGFEDQLASLKETAQTLKLIEVASRFVEDFAMRCKLVEVHDVSYPPKLIWTGATNFDDLDMAEVKVQVARLESDKQKLLRAQVLVETLATAIVEDAEYVERLTVQLADMPAPSSLEELRRVSNDTYLEMREVENRLEGVRESIQEIQMRKQVALNSYQASLAQKAVLESKLYEAKRQVEEVAFNNTLLKKIRAARPIIADRLWSIVLTSVSSMFSAMRGETSVVTKGKDGFSVNGAPATSLSGSTLDLLALALRVALVKTFIPNTSLMTLDEVAGGMDKDRTAKMLGFLAGVGLKQILLVTHDEISETFADQVITL